MAQLLVRDLEESVVVALRTKAAEEGTSVEAHRRVLRAFASGRPEQDFKAFLLNFPHGDAGRIFERHGHPPRDVDLL